MGPYGPNASVVRLTTAESLVGLILLNSQSLGNKQLYSANINKLSVCITAQEAILGQFNGFFTLIFTLKFQDGRSPIIEKIKWP